MCGIAGVIAWDDRYRVDRPTLERMSARIAHRGPDGEGFFLNHEQEVTPDRPQCGFAFRRLAILDPDPRAMQPFTIGDKTIVFNGEIYNFRELRAELTNLQPEYRWRTTGDTEVLLLAYDQWGGQCVDHLNGMFAFALWDEAAKALFLARDRMGQKPLYCAEPLLGGSPKGRPLALAFASELSAVTSVPWVSERDFSNSVTGSDVVQYLRWGYLPGDKTLCPAVQQLLPGETCSFPGNDQRIYFRAGRPAGTKEPQDDLAAVSSTRSLLETAVRRQLVADVPLGCFLSGGVDSSTVAAAMRRIVPRDQPVHTFSIGFDDPRYDESKYAAAVAAHLGTTHHAFRVEPDAATDLPKLAEAFGDPFADSSALPTHYLARETRRHVKVALSGDGGDELFGGYDRYRAMHLSRRLEAIPRAARIAVGASLAWALPGSHPKSRAVRLKRFLGSIQGAAAQRYASYVRLFPEVLVRELLGNPTGMPMPADYLWEFPKDCVVQRAMELDREMYLPGDLLTKVDRASMLHGLEVRSPFMDHELVTFAAGLTTDQLLKGGPKRMLREAFRDDLPSWVFKRKKMGFAVPIGEWFRGELRPMLRDNLFAGDSFGRQHFNMKVVERLVEEHETQRVDHSQRLYALLMLELWWRTARR
jgi:asparagine synthase (glutamine-hydrolysing)